MRCCQGMGGQIMTACLIHRRSPRARSCHRCPILDRTAVTVSGLSSGGYFAHQFHVAFSSLVKGAGILAGGPYGCVEAIPNPWLPFWSVSLDRVSAAVVACTHYYGDLYYGLRPSAPRAEDSLRIIREAADQGLIDNPSNLADSRVWLFHGKSDALVPLQVMEALERLYDWSRCPRAEPPVRPKSDRLCGQSRHAGQPIYRGEQVSRTRMQPTRAAVRHPVRL